MVKRERLYDAFGELIYTIAIADGDIQSEELKALEKLISNHPWAKEIQWSFNYENSKRHTIDEVFEHAINTCKENGPDPEYKYLLDVMIKVAEAFNGIIPEERKLIDNFKMNLTKRFEADLRNNKLVIDND